MAVGVNDGIRGVVEGATVDIWVDVKLGVAI
jgi:hypothetical protein